MDMEMVVFVWVMKLLSEYSTENDLSSFVIEVKTIVAKMVVGAWLAAAAAAAEYRPVVPFDSQENVDWENE